MYFLRIFPIFFRHCELSEQKKLFVKTLSAILPPLSLYCGYRTVLNGAGFYVLPLFVEKHRIKIKILTALPCLSVYDSLYLPKELFGASSKKKKEYHDLNLYTIHIFVYTVIQLLCARYYFVLCSMLYVC